MPGKEKTKKSLEEIKSELSNLLLNNARAMLKKVINVVSSCYTSD